MKLKHVNNLLFVAIVVVLLYVITAPVFPVLVFWAENHATSRLHQLSTQLHVPVPVHVSAANPNEERLVIPAMLVDTPVNEGSDMRALRTGPWHRPNSGTPDRGGNTVIVGHRFTYANPRGVFYYLNKLQPGDEIGLFWHGKRYIYTVTSTTVVPPTDTAVEDPTPGAQLTLYTCTPLWLPKDRLVVVAKLEKP